MTSILHKHETGDFANTATHSLDNTEGAAFEPINYTFDTPSEAFDEAVRFNRSITDYGSLPLDPRLYQIIGLNKLAKSADAFNSIALRPDCDQDTKDKAMAMSSAINTSFESTISDTHGFIAMLKPESGYYTSREAGLDIKDYANTRAISAALLNEQLPSINFRGTTNENNDVVFRRKEDIIRDAVTSIDTGLILEITEQPAEYARAHTLESLYERSQAFVGLIEKLNITQLKVNMHGNLPVANAVTKLISAQALHDLALLGEFDTKRNRDIAVNAAVTDLWDAKEAIASISDHNDMTLGLRETINDFLEKYSKEIGLDPTDPTKNEFEITDAQIAKLVADLGAAAHSASHNPA